MASHFMKYFMIALIISYTLLIFTTIAVEDLMSEEEKETPVQILLWVELFILLIFTVEISLNSYA